MQLTGTIKDAVTNAYIGCALWTDTDDCDQPSSETPVAEAAAREARQQCTDFLAECNAHGLLDQYAATGRTWDSFGNDFWLTRNGHGAGFWDRGMGDLGNRLSEVARSFGEANVYEADGELFIA